MVSPKQWVFVLSIFTLISFSGAWIYFIEQGKKIDKSIIQTEPLRVIAYPTFISQFGPGPEIAQAFSQRHGVQIKWLNAGEPEEVLQKLKLKGEDFKADVVLGLDQVALAKALREFEWLSMHISEEGLRPGLLYGEGQVAFLPFSWSPLGILYRSGQTKPIETLGELRTFVDQNKMSLSHPKTSTAGRHFGQWIFANFNDSVAAELLNHMLGPAVVTPSGWSAAYGLFQRGQVKATFSYLTSIVFHRRELKESDVTWMKVKEPLPVQVEYGAVLARCQQCDLAKKFVQFLHDPFAQKVIMNKNYMLPVLEELARDTEFAEFLDVPTMNLNFELSSDYSAWLEK